MYTQIHNYLRQQVCLFICWLAGLSVGLHKNYWTDFHKTWVEDVSKSSKDPINFWCGSWWKHVFQITLKDHLLFSQRVKESWQHGTIFWDIRVRSVAGDCLRQGEGTKKTCRERFCFKKKFNVNLNSWWVLSPEIRFIHAISAIPKSAAIVLRLLCSPSVRAKWGFPFADKRSDSSFHTLAS